jgi:hypothetical protein
VLIIKKEKRIRRTSRKKNFLYLRKNKNEIRTAAKEKMQAKNKIISSRIIMLLLRYYIIKGAK